MSLLVRVPVKRLDHAADLPLPQYGSDGAAGIDLLAAVESPLSVAQHQRVLIPTGLAVALPDGYELQIRPRSGLALKNGIILPNSPGTIDEDYRGEIKIILLNQGEETFVIERGMRIAQAVLSPVVRIVWDEQTKLNSTQRNQQGFGSTGTN